MATHDSDYFHQLPPLTSETVAALSAGSELSLLLLDLSTEKGILFPVQYTHRELTYRTPGNKDAVAFGSARLNGEGEYRNVRILFSQPRETAALRGLELEGHVKLRT
ncbi:hypothetical protein GCM10027084_02240 [Pseudoxanthomonas sangjuensis]|uniref:hypothetical protein n=1 Tax=Pseudoxanthomonas sangjuensis TaxID=1503750 RepID=UPI00139197D9|nr:hypothetical protein [Pseudoxanthomonas sangjuensis]KAF1713891.1 hypothetical protein CSC71_05805 [Pseudoxanthomonas sangjuensis]